MVHAGCFYVHGWTVFGERQDAGSHMSMDGRYLARSLLRILRPRHTVRPEHKARMPVAICPWMDGISVHQEAACRLYKGESITHPVGAWCLSARY